MSDTQSQAAGLQANELNEFLDRLAATPGAAEKVRELVNGPVSADATATTTTQAPVTPAPSAPTAAEPQRVTFTLPADAIEFLRTEAGRTGMSMADVLRRSLASEKYLQDVRKRGGDLLIEEKGKPLMKLVFRE